MMEQDIKDDAGESGDAAAVPASPGRLLREGRERLGLSVADAAAQIRLAPRQIEALEADDFAALPEMPFVRGFVRNYAKLLHIEAQPLLEMLPQAKDGAARLMPASVEVPFPNAYSPQRQNLIWLGAALLLSVVVVVFSVWHYTTPLHRSEMTRSPSPAPARVAVIQPVSVVPEASGVPAIQEAMTAVSGASAPAAPQPAVTAPVAATPAVAPVAEPPRMVKPAEPAKPEVKPEIAKPEPAKPEPAKPAATTSSPGVTSALRLAFDNESWVDVRDRDGNVVSSQINARGSELNLEGKMPLTLAIGRANSVRLYYKGKQIDLKPHTHATSEVARLTLE